MVALRDAVAYQAELERQPGRAATSSSDVAGAHTCACVCERFFATTSERRLHVADMASDRRPHGPTPDERPQVAGSWVLYDPAKRSVIRAGRTRFGAEGKEDDHSTRGEMRTMLKARQDSQQAMDQFFEAKGGEKPSLRYDTDSQCALDNFRAVVWRALTASRLATRGDTGNMLALRQWEEMHPTRVTLQWSPAQLTTYRTRRTGSTRRR